MNKCTLLDHNVMALFGTKVVMLSLKNLNNFS